MATLIKIHTKEKSTGSSPLRHTMRRVRALITTQHEIKMWLYNTSGRNIVFVDSLLLHLGTALINMSVNSAISAQCQSVLSVLGIEVCRTRSKRGGGGREERGSLKQIHGLIHLEWAAIRAASVKPHVSSTPHPSLPFPNTLSLMSRPVFPACVRTDGTQGSRGQISHRPVREQEGGRDTCFGKATPDTKLC